MEPRNTWARPRWPDAGVKGAKTICEGEWLGLLAVGWLQGTQSSMGDPKPSIYPSPEGDCLWDMRSM
jgi:hypothetical protein